jgi:hypothetical protein
MNEKVVNKGASFFPASLLHAHEEGWGSGRHQMKARVASSLRQQHICRQPVGSVEEGAWLSMTRWIGGGAFGREPAVRRCSSAVVGAASDKSCGRGALCRRMRQEGAAHDGQWKHDTRRQSHRQVGPTRQWFSNFRKTQKYLSAQEICIKGEENLEKFMEVGNSIWRNFCDYSFLKFSMNFELFQRF